MRKDSAQVAGFAVTRFDISDLPTRHNYGLALRQKHIERILAGWVSELAVSIYRSRELTGFTQDDTGVTIELPMAGHCGQAISSGAMEAAVWSAKLQALNFEGGMLRPAASSQRPRWRRSRRSVSIARHLVSMPSAGRSTTFATARLFAKEGPINVMVTEETIGAATEPPLRDLSEALVAACGTDYGIHGLTWISRFTDVSRQAAAYRKGRILLSGDAVHVHSPVGGQGLSLGVQDAVNLGWKLAQVVNGRSPDDLLDTYEAERHPVAARVLRTTMAQVALQRIDDRTEALREVVSELLGIKEPRQRMAAEMSGLAIRYNLGEGHPLVGRRMPNLELSTAKGTLWVYSLLHGGRPAFIHLGVRDAFDVTPWADRVQSIHAEYSGAWELPAIGVVTAPAAVLVRPDGYVAWAGDLTEVGLADALTT